MRRLLQILSVAAAFSALAQPAEAQLRYGLQGAVITGVEEVSGGDYNGTFGIGPRLAFQPPLLPIGVVGQGVYYFPEGDESYMTYSLAAQLRLPLPVFNPYAIGGWQWRRTALDDFSNTENGPMVGIGVQLNLGVALFLEATFEFNDEIEGSPDFDNNPLVIKGGVMLGG
jgi:hypothetical protein